MAASFAERVTRELDYPVDDVCAARPPGTVTTSAICAGIGAGVGSVLAARCSPGSAAGPGRWSAM
jgi:hypothetical protein